MARVLFVCRQNAGRSQMSQALFRALAGGRHQALSAGSSPAQTVHPEVVAAMQEVGVDLSGRTPLELDEDLLEWADLVVTMGCADTCPDLRGARQIDWDLPDPHGQPLEEVRALRERIRIQVRELVRGLDATAVKEAA